MLNIIDRAGMPAHEVCGLMLSLNGDPSVDCGIICAGGAATHACLTKTIVRAGGACMVFAN